VSTTLGDVITAARDQHWAFSVERVPSATIARYLSRTQNELIAAASKRDRQYLAQTAVVSLAIGSANSPGIAGAGTSGGLPGRYDGTSLETSQSSTGSLIEASLLVSDGAVYDITDALVTSATGSTLTQTGAGRTTDADAEKLLVITAGPGEGEQLEVLSNTSDTWTLDGTWVTTPTEESTFSLVTPVLVSDDTAGVVTGLPSVETHRGYLVKLDDQGLPYIDYDAPVMATVEDGVSLPTMTALLPDLCQYWTTDGCAYPLHVTSAAGRFTPQRFPAVYTIGSTLYFCGRSCDWTDVASIEVRYVPLAPSLTALTDLFLLPDHARPVLEAKAAAFMAMRVNGMPDVTIDPSVHAGESERAERQFYQTVVMGKRGRPARMREAF